MFICLTAWFLKLCLRRISVFLTTCAKSYLFTSPFLCLVMLSISVTFWTSISSSAIVVFATPLLSSPGWRGLVMIEGKLFSIWLFFFFGTKYYLRVRISSHTAKSLFFSSFLHFYSLEIMLHPNWHVCFFQLYFYFF